MFTTRRSITRTIASISFGAIAGLSAFGAVANADTPPADPEVELVEAVSETPTEEVNPDLPIDDGDQCNPFDPGALTTAVATDPKWKTTATYTDAEVCDGLYLMIDYVDRKSTDGGIDDPAAEGKGGVGIDLQNVVWYTEQNGAWSDTNFYATPCHWGVRFSVGTYDEELDSIVGLQTIAIYAGDLECGDDLPDPEGQSGTPGGGLPETGAETTLLLSGMAALLVAAGVGLTTVTRRRQVVG